MAVRTTSAKVLEILDGCTVSSTVVDSFIGTASRVLDSVFSSDSSMTTAQLQDIETWLAAHLISSTLHRQSSQEEVDGASVQYTGYWSKNLDSTSYGQMVMVIDTSGKMAGAGKKLASLKAITSFD